jgi:hypothetical protein
MRGLVSRDVQRFQKRNYIDKIHTSNINLVNKKEKYQKRVSNPKYYNYIKKLEEDNKLLKFMTDEFQNVQSKKRLLNYEFKKYVGRNTTKQLNRYNLLFDVKNHFNTQTRYQYIAPLLDIIDGIDNILLLDGQGRAAKYLKENSNSFNGKNIYISENDINNVFGLYVDSYRYPNVNVNYCDIFSFPHLINIDCVMFDFTSTLKYEYNSIKNCVKNYNFKMFGITQSKRCNKDIKTRVILDYQNYTKIAIFGSDLNMQQKVYYKKQCKLFKDNNPNCIVADYKRTVSHTLFIRNDVLQNHIKDIKKQLDIFYIEPDTLITPRISDDTSSVLE